VDKEKDEDLLSEWEKNTGNIQATNPFADSKYDLSYTHKLAGQQKQKLAALALSVSLDSFDKVKEAMEKLIGELK